MSYTILNKWVAHTEALAFSLLMDSKSKYTSLTLAELSWVILDRIALNNDVELESIRSLINCAALKLPFIRFLPLPRYLRVMTSLSNLL